MTSKTSPEKAIALLYAELSKYCQNSDYERALKTTNRILGVAHREILAFKCKIACLIELSKFEDAIAHINKYPEFLSTFTFERAYCLYRTNKHENALNIIENDSGQELDPRIQELKAQILYRLEKYEEAKLIYQEIVKNCTDDYEEERLANLYATMAYSNSNVKLQEIDGLKADSYELIYNQACILIYAGHYQEAEKKLKQCEKLWKEKLDDEDMTDEEIDVEMALLRIQLAFVYQKQGRIKEARSIYLAVLKLKLDDIPLQSIVNNNVVCINRDQNLFDSKKKMKFAYNETAVSKLSRVQRKHVVFNSCILSYYTHSDEQCIRICKEIETKWPELAPSVTAIRAMILMRTNKFDEALKLLKQYNCSNKDKLFIQFCIAQLYLLKGDKLEACKILQNLGDDSYKPGIVGALTTLYLGMEDETTALDVFTKAVQFYKNNKTTAADLSKLWKQAADFHIRNGHPEIAANSLEELLSATGDDQKVIAQLLLACSEFDKNRALKLSEKLPSIKELSVGVNLQNIQTVIPTVSKKHVGTPQAGTPKTDESQKKQRIHKKRKGKLPKYYDPTVAPDPERWLPKYERTGIRKKRDKRNKDVLKGSQGTSSGSAEQYDFSKKAEELNDSPMSIDQSPQLIQKRSSQNLKKSQKKKNKRR